MNNLNLKGVLIPDNDPAWKNILNNPKINELFEGIEHAETDIKNGEKGIDFDKFFEEFNRTNLNGMLFKVSNS